MAGCCYAHPPRARKGSVGTGAQASDTQRYRFSFSDTLYFMHEVKLAGSP